MGTPGAEGTEEERGAEAEELGAESEEPLFLPTPTCRVRVRAFSCLCCISLV
jgi:hypothetical protein